ncbi:DUF3152 domain-containing protein [Jatrophihabitans telluris]|uniref:DUF3152 domain-containing protein n=1 Tax=Jatrophihabitans telluris TaxID=2038343 RepID=A0ABY4QV30_9ACTN|nr:DUF3152 domain-containing protein [Jatrophihabitans telluris]UQX86731.1 DUF3152 domain-containing protein [Jatrophihabitans telluris]
MRPHAIRAALSVSGVVLAATGAVVVALASHTSQPAGAASGTVRFTYVVRGMHNSSSLSTFASLAAQTYADPRGWSLGGSVTLSRVNQGGDFTLWLAAAADVPSFGSPCDSSYSCTVGRDVIINESRWLGATAPWKSAHGSLSDYRHMVLNHETGHWLGFGHSFCGGPGQLAPVMQQQSISLQGCRFNPWPLASERRALAGRLHVVIRTGQPVGAWDSATVGVGRIRFTGWALDPDTTKPVTIKVTVDGTAHRIVAAEVRTDVARAYPSAGSHHGFSYSLTIRPGRHRACLTALNTLGPGASTRLGCRSVVVSASPVGVLDPVRTSAGHIEVTGWAIDPDTTRAIRVHVYVDQLGMSLGADRKRASVGAAYPHYGPDHGFALYTVVPVGPHRVCAYALNAAGAGTTKRLGCQSVTVTGG